MSAEGFTHSTRLVEIDFIACDRCGYESEADRGAWNWFRCDKCKRQVCINCTVTFDARVDMRTPRPDTQPARSWTVLPVENCSFWARFCGDCGLGLAAGLASIGFKIEEPESPSEPTECSE